MWESPQKVRIGFGDPAETAGGVMGGVSLAQSEIAGGVPLISPETVGDSIWVFII